MFVFGSTERVAASSMHVHRLLVAVVHQPCALILPCSFDNSLPLNASDRLSNGFECFVKFPYPID